MKCNINGSEYNFIKNVIEDEQARKSFNLLAHNIFGLDFDYWGNDYIPYVLMDGAVVVSNVSVNIINTLWKGQTKHYIQLGTVMTDEVYRGKGLSRWLMEKVIDDWIDKCDSIYLFANDSVLGFYPRFGFEKALEYQYQKTIKKKEGIVEKLDMSLVQDRRLLLDTYKFSNPFSMLPMECNDELLMFYCSQFMRENVYYIDQYKAVVIAEYEDEKLVCYDIFCQSNCIIDDILSMMAKGNTKTAILGFTPKQIEDFTVEEFHEKDTTLFVLSGKENLFAENRLMFPLLSHA